MTIRFDLGHDLDLEFSRSNMKFAISQPKVVRRSGVRIYQIVTGVTSDVGVPSTHLGNNIPALVQIMAWRRPGDKPLSEPMMVNLLTHICVTRPQWVKEIIALLLDLHQRINLSLSTNWLQLWISMICNYRSLWCVIMDFHVLWIIMEMHSSDFRDKWSELWRSMFKYRDL